MSESQQAEDIRRTFDGMIARGKADGFEVVYDGPTTMWDGQPAHRVDMHRTERSLKMSFFSREAIAARWVRVRESASNVWDGFTNWWSTTGKAEAKHVLESTIGPLLAQYKEAALKLVRDLALGAVKPEAGESKGDAFVRLFKAMLDSSGDGHVTAADIPDSAIKFFREYVYALFMTKGATNEERAAAVNVELGA